MQLQRVMVVEDEMMVALNEEAIVIDMTGAQILIAPTAERARTAVSSGNFDLAILDVMLPDGNSFEIADLLRLNATPYIFVTAFGRAHIPVRHRAAPVVGKPFHEAELRMALSEILISPRVDRPKPSSH